MDRASRDHHSHNCKFGYLWYAPDACESQGSEKADSGKCRDERRELFQQAGRRACYGFPSQGRISSTLDCKLCVTSPGESCDFWDLVRLEAVAESGR
jgi:hypothetical protein